MCFLWVWRYRVSSCLNRGLSVVAVAGSLLGFVGLAQANSELVEASLSAHARYVPGEMLVQFHGTAALAARQSALALVGGRSIERLRAANGSMGELHRIRLPEGSSVAAAMRLLGTNGFVKFAEPNWVYTAQSVATDPYYVNGSQWGMYGATSPLFTNTYGSGAAMAWDRGNTCLKKIHVGVMDEGIMLAHNDLLKNVWVNPDEVVNGVDEDGSGYVDDINGWDFVNNDNTVFDDVTDEHGTQVAGVIGARGGDDKGIAGVCWGVNMIPAKMMTNGTGNAALAVKAMDYLTGLKYSKGIKLVAISAAWGGGGFSQAFSDAIGRAGAANILVVAAAGNSSKSNDTAPFYPASYALDNVISVAALTEFGTLASYSNYGATTVHIAAPGTAIETTNPVIKKGVYKSGYASLSGTSFASAFVVGAAAMYASSHQSAKAPEIKAAILNSAIPTNSLNGKVITGARLDMSTF